MPTYQYACTACGHQLEAVQSFADDPLTQCPECAGRLRKLFGSVGVVFKGSGFYRTDSRAAANGNRGNGNRGDGNRGDGNGGDGNGGDNGRRSKDGEKSGESTSAGKEAGKEKAKDSGAKSSDSKAPAAAASTGS